MSLRVSGRLVERGNRGVSCQLTLLPRGRAEVFQQQARRLVDGRKLGEVSRVCPRCAEYKP